MLITGRIDAYFNTDILQQIDELAKSEARTRSELIREAARMYIERKKRWESIFAYGESLSAKYGFTEEDVIIEFPVSCNIKPSSKIPEIFAFININFFNFYITAMKYFH